MSNSGHYREKSPCNKLLAVLVSVKKLALTLGFLDCEWKNVVNNI